MGRAHQKKVTKSYNWRENGVTVLSPHVSGPFLLQAGCGLIELK